MARLASRSRGRRWPALGLVGLAGLVYVLAVGLPPGRAVDDAMRPDGAEGTAWRLVLGVFVDTLRASTSGLAAVAVVAVAWRREGLAPAVRYAIALLGANATTFGLEKGLAAIDPLRAEAARGLGSGFFPSGHATAALSLGLAAVLVAGPRHRRLVTRAAASYGAIVGVALVATDSHTPSDVLGGYLVAAAWILAVLPRGSWRDDDLRGRAPAAALVASALALAALLWQPPATGTAAFAIAAGALAAASFALTAYVPREIRPTRAPRSGSDRPPPR